MSVRKRSAGMATSPDLETPDPVKKRKKNDDTHFPDEETPQSTTEIGLKLVKQLKNSKDKTGRNVAGHFLKLPDEKKYPEYYDQVQMPISLDMVQAKLENYEYATMEKLESDLKRLVQNAKEFNSTKSEVYEDAERIRKALSNFMPKHNPAYLDPAYRAYPTPLPGRTSDGRHDSTNTPARELNSNSDSLKIKLPNIMGARRKSSAQPTEDDNGTEDDMISKQIEIIDQMKELPNAENFYEKPSKRQYPDYYQLIARPTSLTDIRKQVEKGRFPAWDAFIAEMRLIWSNAKVYNDDGSQIYLFAEALEDWFEDQISKMGFGPKRLKLTVKEPTRLKLRVGTPASVSTPVGGSIDNDSLRRQREETGQALARAQSTDKKGAMPQMPAADTNGKRSMSIAGTPGRIDSAKVEENCKEDTSAMPAESSRSTQLSDGQQPQNTKTVPTPIMQPPHFATGPPPAGTQFGGQINFAPAVVPKPSFERDSPFDRIYRDQGKGIQDALLSGVTFMTCPRMPNDPKWKVTRYASSTMTQTAAYVYLPSDHYYLRVMPHLTDELRSRKKYKMVVCRNWETLIPQQDIPDVYDFRIHPGENNIIVDVVAELKEGESKPYAPPQLQLDFERIQYIVILRDPTPDITPIASQIAERQAKEFGLHQGNYVNKTIDVVNRTLGKHVLVIGGTSGIGYAVAEAAIENGARVTVSSSREESVKMTLERLSKSYPNARVAGYACDLSKPSVEADAEVLFQQVGTVDYIVYAAGDKLATMSFQDISIEYFIKAGQLRFFAPFFVAKVGSRYITPGPRSSITITAGSIAERPIGDWAVVGSYAAGLHRLLRSLALELKPVRVNLVQPKGIATDLWKDTSSMEPNKRDALYRHSEESFPTGAVGQAEDVAEAYLWLMKDKNVTGRVAASDSGHSLISS